MESIMQKTLYVAMLAVIALAACEKRLDQSKSTAPEQLAATGTSGNLVGTSPAPPTAPEGTETTPVDPNKPLKETAQTTSSAEDSKELTKAEESQKMPLPGQPNDHSNVAPDASQKAGKTDPKQ
jgi:nitrous oxide reductase accessory protein NosL